MFCNEIYFIHDIVGFAELNVKIRMKNERNQEIIP
jgi:hypothetical protein